LPLNPKQLEARIADGQKLIESTTPSPAFKPYIITANKFDVLLQRSLNCLTVSTSFPYEDDNGNSSSNTYRVAVNGNATPYTLPANFEFAHCTSDEISAQQQKDWSRGHMNGRIAFGPFNDPPNAYDTELKPGAKKAFDQATAAIETRQQIAITYAAAELTKARRGEITLKPEVEVFSSRPLSSNVSDAVGKVITFIDRATRISDPSAAPAPR
jgi:hypothetical protein